MPKEDTVSPKVGVKQTGPKKTTLTDLNYTIPNLVEIEAGGLTEEEQEKYRRMALNGAHARAESIGNMGILQNVDKQENDIELAKRRTFQRRKNMSPREKAIQQLLRDPQTGVMPRDVRCSGKSVIIDN